MQKYHYILILLSLAVFSTPLLGQYQGTAPFTSSFGGLFINEISQGISGSGGGAQEYVEFVVTAGPNPSASVNLEGFVIDDNNFPGSGAGNAQGHLKFGSCYQAVPPGALIVVYNANDANPLLVDDPTDANGDMVYIIPHDDACLVACNGSPSSTNGNFCPCTGGIPPSGSSWQSGMSNSNDAFQVRDVCGTLVHSAFYGITLAQTTFGTAPVAVNTGFMGQGGKVIAFECTTSNDWDNAANFVNINSSTGQTPGVANNAANDALIQSIRNGTFVATGTVVSCDIANAGHVTPPLPFTAPPVGICPGIDLGAFGHAYNGVDEIDPTALGSGLTFEYGYVLTESAAPNNIISFGASGDFAFAALPAGTYHVYGLSYYGGSGATDLATFMATQVNVTGLSTGGICASSLDLSSALVVTISATPALPITGGGSFCAGTDVLLSVDSNPLATYSWAGPGGASSATSSLALNGLTLAQTGTYTVTATAFGCQAVGMTNVQISLSGPTVTLTGDALVCTGNAANLVFTTPSAANFPLNITYALTDGTTGSFVVNGSPQNEQLNLSNSTTVTLTSISDAAGCANNAPATNLNIGVSSGPTYTGEFIQCLNATNEYTVSLNISGTPPFTVSGTNGGNVIGTAFMSNNIAMSSLANFTIGDAGGCTTAYSGNSLSCVGCTSSAGTMSLTGITLCASDDVSGQHNGNMVLDGNDLMLFYLFTNLADPLASVVDINTTPNFTGLSAFPAGTTLYIAAVVGTAAINGTDIDPFDPCISVSNAQQVVITAEPQIQLDIPLLNCGVNTADATLTILNPAAAPGPYNIVVTINSVPLPAIVTSNAVTVVSLPTGLTGINNSVSVSVTAGVCNPVNAVINGISFFGVSESDLAQTLCPGQTATVEGQVFDQTNPTGDVVVAGGSFSGCDSTIHVALTYLPQLTAILSASQTSVCPGDSVQITVSLPGAPLPFDATVNPGNHVFTAVNGSASFWVHPISNEIYTITSAAIAAAPCPINLGSPVSLFINGFDINVVATTNYNGYEVRCFDSANGAALAGAQGGSSPYTFEWSNGQTSAYNNNLDPGNYIVTVTDVTGCFAIDSVMLDAPDGITLDYFPTEPTCYNTNDGIITVTNIIGGFPGYDVVLEGQSYEHTDGDSLEIPFVGIGFYELVVVDSNNCQYPVEVQVPGPPPFVLNLGDDITVNYGDSVELAGYANFDIDTSIWTPATWLNRADTAYVICRPYQQITYTMVASDTAGCSASDQITIYVTRDDNVFFPTVFTPNLDGLNDYFTVFANLRQVNRVVSLRIYDRWGEQVFNADDIPPSVENLGWDGNFRGKPLTPAVFVWYVELEFFDGVIKQYKGDVTLLR